VLDKTGRYCETIGLIEAISTADHPCLRNELRAAQSRGRAWHTLKTEVERQLGYKLAR
jgi:hypothetical protein